ncbi:MAG: siderophore-interacting protein [Pseudomonadota bacterium]
MIRHFAYLASSPDLLIEGLSAIALKNGYEVDPRSTGVSIRAPLGHVEIARTGVGGVLTFGAATPSKLQLLKDLYAGRIANLGMADALTWERTTAKRPLNQIHAEVVSCDRISPNFMRVRLLGEFGAFAQPGAGLHFRFLFSPDGADWPSLDLQGLTYWPGGAKSWHRPPYTVRAIGADADWIDVDIVLHEGGRVTDWCTNVALGTEVALHGPSGSSQPKAGWLGLIGDETALPIVLRIVEDAPEGTDGQAIILVRDPEDAQPIETASSISVEWKVMGVDDPVELIRQLQPPAADFHIFLAAERRFASEARDVFRELQFPSGAAKAASYWTA